MIFYFMLMTSKHVPIFKGKNIVIASYSLKVVSIFVEAWSFIFVDKKKTRKAIS